MRSPRVLPGVVLRRLSPVRIRGHVRAADGAPITNVRVAGVAEPLMVINPR